MQGFNYHHLYYFYTVARLGTIARASEELQLTQPTISEQIRLLESSLESKLFEKSGRNLVLTHAGKTVFSYAEKIFALGQELKDSIDGNGHPNATRCSIGIAKGAPSSLVFRILKPAMSLGRVVTCRNDRLESLLVQLATHELDFVLSDSPIPRIVNVSLATHKLGECGISFFANETIASSYKPKFPNSLDSAPLILPWAQAEKRSSLEKWFKSVPCHPEIVAEFEDATLSILYCKSGAGILAAPSIAERELIREHGLKVIGRTQEVVEHFYLISAERTLRNPAAVAIVNHSRERIFA